MDHLNDEELAAVSALLSSERLSTFERLAGSNRGAIALHQEMLRLAAALMTVTAVVEIALRNAVCDQLTEHFGTADWLRNPPERFVWGGEERQKIRRAEKSARQAAYAKLTQEQKRSLDAVAYENQGGVAPPGTPDDEQSKARQAAIQVPMGQVVAQLTMYFWKRLFSPDYEQSLWRPALKRVFPHKAITRPEVARHLEAIYQCRNRIAHHEPVYGRRLRETEAAFDFVARHLGVRGIDGATPLEKLLQPEMAELHDRAEAMRGRIQALQGETNQTPQLRCESSEDRSSTNEQ
ncbi:Abi-like protein [Cupriavidus gilardii J11]|uniref:Abi-like protein n=1 Tax=Cupriavidus gilardii J11 TaxID=936133 RepID=A0A562BT31_9BURK|nr:Abi family protein [Cupriavidus gilardii]TWG87950.1 Abi-like protein [Cupriavidus gilardii J11]